MKKLANILLVCNFLASFTISAHAAPIAMVKTINSSGLNNPYKLCITSNDYIYAVDTSNNQIKKLDPNGNIVFSFGSYGSGDGQFDQPQGITADNDNNIYVIDTGNHRIQKLHDNGTSASFVQVIGTLPSDGSAFRFPRSARVDDQGLLYIVDTSNNRVIQYATGTAIGTGKNAGISAMSVGGSGAASPYGADIDSGQYVFVADTQKHKIQKFSANGQLLLEFGKEGREYGEFLYPYDIAVGGDGNIYIADTGNNRIQKFTPDGKYITAIDGQGKFLAPRGLYIENGYLYVIGADNKIQKYDIAIHIINVRVSNSMFSPNGDGTKDQTNIQFYLSDPAIVDLDIYDASGVVLVRKLLSGQKMSGGENTVSWGGADNNDKVLSEGNYVIRITAKPDSGQKDGSSTTTNAVIDITPPVLAFSADYSALSPNGDGLQDVSTLSYKVGDNLSPNTQVLVSIEQNQSGRLLSKELLSDPAAMLDTNYQISWDGKLSNYLVEGKFIAKLQATDQAGNTTMASTDLLIDITSPRLESARVDHEYFSPNGDERKDNTTLSFSLTENLSEKSRLILILKDQEGKEVAKLKDAEDFANGNQSLIWDGRLSPLLTEERGAGVRSAQDGEYCLVLSATDSAGNTGTCEAVKVVVDTVPPTIMGLAALPNPFTPNMDGINDTAQFSYSLSEPCFTELTIYNAQNSLYRKHSLYDIEQDKWDWDGSGARGELIGGSYTYVLYAEDRAANSSTSEVQTILVDRESSLIPYAYADPDPFAPVNPANDHTTIKYYVSRDNVKVSLNVIGNEGRVIKTLVKDEIKNKGEYNIEWKGDFDAGYTGSKATKDPNRVYDGAYQFTVSAEDLNEGQKEEVTNTVLVDNIVPNILMAPVEVDLVNKKAALKYTLPESSKVEVAVYDLNGILVSKLLDAQPQDTGEHQIEWTNSNDQAGEVYFKVKATDKALNESEKQSDPFSIISTLNLQISNLTASPNPATPNGDGHTDQTLISYKLGGGAPDYKVNINILNSAGATVKHLVVDELQSSGTYSFYWDGKNDQGNFVADGNYDYVISIQDKLGASAENRGTFLIVSTIPAITLSSDLSTFSPNSDGSQDNVRFTYSVNYPVAWITDPAQVKLEVIDSVGTVVWNKIFSYTAGIYSYEWDGLLSPLLSEERGAGVRSVQAGEYSIRISATDALGTPALPVTLPLEVNYSQPTISLLSSSPNPFSPQGDGVKDSIQVTYGLAEAANMTIKVIRASDNQVIKTLVNDQAVNQYLPLNSQSVRIMDIPTVTWDGRNESGQAAADGKHIMDFYALDEAGNSHRLQNEVWIDTANPSAPILAVIPATTNEAMLNLSGAGEANNEIEIYINEEKAVSLSANGGGEFGSAIGLISGDNRIFARAIDPAGNVSSASAIQTVHYETELPQISNLTVTPNPAKAGPLDISFEISEPLKSNPAVMINGQAALLSKGASNSYEYIYYIPATELQGAANLTIDMTDLAGNSNRYASDGLLSVDTISPSRPELASLPAHTNAQILQLTGEAEAGSTLKIYDNELVADTITVPASGKFSQTINLYPGENQIYVTASDIANNLSTASVAQLVIFETDGPVFSNISINPDPACAGPAIIQFSVSEPLSADPQVRVNGNPATLSANQNLLYAYVYTVTNSDLQGTAAVILKAADLAGNNGEAAARFTIDTVGPVISEVNLDPNPAQAGILNIGFKASEDLNANPQVKVNGNSAAFELRILQNGLYQYRYTYLVTTSDLQGAGIVSIEATDPAQNIGQVAADDLKIDTVTPTIDEISATPELAKAGLVSIKFNSTEELINPEVTVNGNSAGFSSYSLSLNTYSFSYVVTDNDQLGPAVVKISGADAAHNMAAKFYYDLEIDNQPPSMEVNVNVAENPRITDTAYARAGAKVEVTIAASEDLLADPIVYIGANLAVKEGQNGRQYAYSHIVDLSDPEGTIPIQITLTDQASNSVTKTFNNLVVDSTHPSTTSFNISPDPAKAAKVTVDFVASELLNQTPILKIKSLCHSPL